MKISLIVMLMCMLNSFLFAETPKLYLTSQFLEESGPTEVMLKIENVEDVYGFEINLTFDPNKIEILSITESDFLGDDTFWMPPNIDNDAGKVINIVSVRIGQKNGVTGSGILARITLQPKAGLDNPGIAMLAIEEIETKLATPLAQPIVSYKRPAALKNGTPKEGDFNLDGEVNLEDFSILASYWLAEPQTENIFSYWADTNNSDKIGIEDLLKVCDNWLN